MWDPTHVQVTVQRARGLVIKGKNGTNNCFVTIALGKEKFQTSVKHKATSDVEWLEECELRIPAKGNTAEIVLKVLDEDFVKDRLLGQVAIPLGDLDVYERPRSRVYKLRGKPGKEGDRERGELEVRIGFTVREGSLADLGRDKHRTSLSSLAHNVGGSLLSIGSSEQRKGLKKFAKNLGSKINLNRKEKKSDSSSPSSSLGTINPKNSAASTPDRSTRERPPDADPGVISEDDDEFAFDDLSHKSSASSLNVHTLPRGHKYTPSPVNASLENLGGGEFLRRSTSSNLAAPDRSAPAKPVRLSLETYAPPQVPAPQLHNDEWSQKLYSKPKSQSQSMIDREKSASLERNKKLDSPNSLKEKPSPKFFKKLGGRDKPKKLLEERIIVGEEKITEEESGNPAYSALPPTLLQQFQNKSREDLIVMVCSLQKEMEMQKKKGKDLENYLDELLLRVMETTPRILQNPYSKNNSMHIRHK